MINDILRKIIQLKVINFPIFLITLLVLYISLVYLDLLQLKKFISITIILIISIITNPPVLIGSLIFLRINKIMSFVWMKELNEDTISDTRVFHKQFKRISKIKKRIDFWGRLIPKSIFISHLQTALYLENIKISKVVNPTKSVIEDNRHEFTFLMIDFGQQIMSYVKTFINYSSEKSQTAINNCIDAMSRIENNPHIKAIVSSTHYDGEGFLSTLITLYDIYFYYTLEKQSKNKINEILSLELFDPTKVGWLSHRFLEYIIYQSYSGKESDQIKSSIKILMQRINDNADEEKLTDVKYTIRNEILKELYNQ